MTKSQLAIKLSKLKTFAAPKLQTEQYATDSETAANIIWNAYMLGDIEGKTIADFGCGAGIFGIACLLLGAKKVYFVDIDEAVLTITAANLKSLNLKNYELIHGDVNKIELTADVVVQNPPFGTKQKHADRKFLIKAFKTACVIYSVHKTATTEFIWKISKDNNFRITNIVRFELPIKHQHSFHRKRIHRIEVSSFRMQKL